MTVSVWTSSWRPQGCHPRLCGAGCGKVVDGGPSPTMTGSGHHAGPSPAVTGKDHHFGALLLAQESAAACPDRVRRAGFTLIEILVVLVILGLALSVVAGFVPRSHPVLDLSTATDTLARTLRGARARAIATQQAIVFTILPGGTGYALDGVPHAFPATVRAAMTDARVIRFGSDGSSSGGTIRLVGGTHIRILTVDWLTGRVSVTNAG